MSEPSRMVLGKPAREGESPVHERRASEAGVHSGVRTAESMSEPSRMVLGKPAREGESPVHERRASEAGSRVPRDTCNLVGMSGDHPVRLNTT